jgi:maltose alpha-D-glucosyltransferase/alpha-amylase
MNNPLWFKDAVIYEVPVKAFHDSNGDGIGDFRGMIERIDYFVELGVNAIWLLPFYPSPQRDDGYDIADYYNVNPAYGTIDDFKELLDEAHKRGIRVITELVINHTSDQNPWFQAARRAPAGSPTRDLYVWSDTPNKYTEARIIFKDFEPSNWSWDPVAKAYYWHRFYHHQPDLNFENPAVHEAVEQVLNYWLEMGVDGLRLDAIPYLFEREGTNCENLPETHKYLKSLRAHMDQKFGDRMFLAEANQRPEDAAAYFGDGDECHMNFHFPIMPRLFMSLQMEDRFPIIDILEQTPPIPPNCQWATFLRNHDELTLEMVTDEERDYMYRVYADDPRARINLGIRRRLAPLLGNNRRRIELINGLLFSLPGTPILYYGDEIGMGDNFYLGDRNGVRTPMQWAPDRNGGFSKANPQQLYLPTIIDPEYHYEAVNVENQRRNPSSLFWWMRRLIAERKRWRAFGQGTIKFFTPENAKVLAFVREFEEEVVLVVANLSRFTQATEIDLSAYAGVVPMEIFSRTRLPELKATPAMFTLGPHDFYWIALRRKGQQTSQEGALQVPVFERELAWSSPFAPGTREFLEREVLPAYLQATAWFPKDRQLREITVSEDLAIGGETKHSHLLLLRASFSDGLPETFALPLQLSGGEAAARYLAESPRAVLARLKSGEEEKVLHDAMLDPAFRAALLRSFAHANGAGRHLHTRQGAALKPEDIERLAVSSQVVSLERANATVSYGGELFLKLFRRLEWGRQPEEDVTRYLHEARKFPHVAPYAGTLSYQPKGLQPATLGLLFGYVANQGDAWLYSVDHVDRYFERLLATRPEITPEALADAIGGHYPERARQLGHHIAEMHLALAADSDHAGFAPEPFTTLYQRSLYQAVRGQVRRTNRLLSSHRWQLPQGVQNLADEVVRDESVLIERVGELLRRKLNAFKTVVHGALHLEQVLNTGKDWVIVDLEGDPSRPLSERSLKRSPLYDVANVIRSFDYAGSSALKRQQPNDVDFLTPWARVWADEISGQFLTAYLQTAAAGTFLPDNGEDLELLLDVLLIERTVAELTNELVHRPALAAIPIRALSELIARKGRSGLVRRVAAAEEAPAVEE